uniref:Uncharacterized protein n=1 Tax=viral metagenome TaxID=1070528 RepID=A0A6M3L051_9ZZZZ
MVMNKRVKEIRLNFKITYSDGSLRKYNWQITGFMFRKLCIVSNKKLYIRTATEIRDWFMKMLQDSCF